MRSVLLSVILLLCCETTQAACFGGPVSKAIHRVGHRHKARVANRHVGLMVPQAPLIVTPPASIPKVMPPGKLPATWYLKNGVWIPYTPH